MDKTFIKNKKKYRKSDKKREPLILKLQAYIRIAEVKYEERKNGSSGTSGFYNALNEAVETAANADLLNKD